MGVVADRIPAMIPARGRARQPLLVLALVVSLLLTACADEPDVAPTQTADPGATPTAEPGETGDGAPPAPVQPPDRPNTVLTAVSWILDLGPGAPEGPAAFELFRLIQQRRCAEVLGSPQLDGQDNEIVRLYEGTARACLAAFDGQTDLWDRADTDHSFITPSDLSCIDRAVYALLERLLDAHQENPNGRFEARTGSSAQGTGCPTIVGLEPSSGPPGTEVTVTLGGTLSDGDSIEILLPDGSTAESRQVPSGGDPVVLTVGAGDYTGPVCFVLLTLDPQEWYASGVGYLIEGNSSTEGSATSAPCPPKA